jgi:plasmid stabilization system protein ParE
MTRTVRVRPEAERDIESAYAWYEEQRPGLGREFLDELELVYERITTFPLMYADVYRGLRRAISKRFPVCLIYVATASEIRILAVAHFARDPSVWRSRR